MKADLWQRLVYVLKGGSETCCECQRRDEEELSKKAERRQQQEYEHKQWVERHKRENPSAAWWTCDLELPHGAKTILDWHHHVRCAHACLLWLAEIDEERLGEVSQFGPKRVAGLKAALPDIRMAAVQYGTCKQSTCLCTKQIKGIHQRAFLTDLVHV